MGRRISARPPHVKQNSVPSTERGAVSRVEAAWRGTGGARERGDGCRMAQEKLTHSQAMRDGEAFLAVSLRMWVALA